jgi:hypothetical protein
VNASLAVEVKMRELGRTARADFDEWILDNILAFRAGTLFGF